MNLDEKKKKRLMIAGGAMVAVALVIGIASQFGGNSKEADILPVETETAAEMEVIATTAAKTTIVVTTERTREEATTEKETEAETLPPQTDLPEQSIQLEVTKPAEPSQGQRTNPTQKPNGETVAETSAVAHEEVVVPTEAPRVEEVAETEAATVQETTVSAETGNSNQTYVPGFGWIEGSGDTQVIIADDMYENGNKIGSME